MPLFGVRTHLGTAWRMTAAVVVVLAALGLGRSARSLETLRCGVVDFARSHSPRVRTSAADWLPDAPGHKAWLVKRGWTGPWVVGLGVETRQRGSRMTCAGGRGVDSRVRNAASVRFGLLSFGVGWCPVVRGAGRAARGRRSRRDAGGASVGSRAAEWRGGRQGSQLIFPFPSLPLSFPSPR